MIELTINIKKGDKSVELTLLELQNLHAQIETMLSSATIDDDYNEDDDGYDFDEDEEDDW